MNIEETYRILTGHPAGASEFQSLSWRDLHILLEIEWPGSHQGRCPITGTPFPESGSLPPLEPVFQTEKEDRYPSVYIVPLCHIPQQQ